VVQFIVISRHAKREDLSWLHGTSAVVPFQCGIAPMPLLAGLAANAGPTTPLRQLVCHAYHFRHQLYIMACGDTLDPTKLSHIPLKPCGLVHTVQRAASDSGSPHPARRIAIATFSARTPVARLSPSFG
jgi:hypothetical protein